MHFTDPMSIDRPDVPYATTPCYAILRLHLAFVAHEHALPLHPPFSLQLSLHFKLEVEERWVEVVYSNVSVLTTTAV